MYKGLSRLGILTIILSLLMVEGSLAFAHDWIQDNIIDPVVDNVIDPVVDFVDDNIVGPIGDILELPGDILAGESCSDILSCDHHGFQSWEGNCEEATWNTWYNYTIVNLTYEGTTDDEAEFVVHVNQTVEEKQFRRTHHKHDCCTDEEHHDNCEYYQTVVHDYLLLT